MLKKLKKLGLVSIVTIAGGVSLFWGLNAGETYCVEYDKKMQCVEEMTTKDIVSVLEKEFIEKVDNFCIEKIKEEKPNAEYYALYSFIKENKNNLTQGEYDLTRLVSDGSRFVYCTEEEYKIASFGIFDQVISSYDEETKMATIENYNDFALLNGMIQLEVERKSISMEDFYFDPSNSEGIYRIIKAINNS